MTEQIEPPAAPNDKPRGVFHPFRVAVLRGLGVALPPLLTIVIFLWIGGTIEQYVIVPLTTYTRNVWALAIADVRTGAEIPSDKRSDKGFDKRSGEDLDKRSGEDLDKRRVVLDGRTYYRVSRPRPRSLIVIDGVTYRPADEVTRAADKDVEYVPQEVYAFVWENLRGKDMPQTGIGVYQRFVELKHLPTHRVVLVFIPLFVIVLYLLGKFMAAGAGRFFWGTFERGIHQVPFVRKVYGSVKQVSDFLLTEPEIEYSRVVAVEWPRKGIWCLALVTGPSFKEVWDAAGEEVLSVLVPTSPMPMTGFTVTVKKSETVDLEISVDEAIQFIVSCGVVVPPEHVKKLQAAPDASPELVAASDSAESKSGDP